MKLYRITYNDGDWYIGGPPTIYFIANSVEEVKEKSDFYKRYKEQQELFPYTSLKIWEVTNLCELNIENGRSFNVTFNEKEK